jgi:O-antigen/teichoic acid export membrane protein
LERPPAADSAFRRRRGQLGVHWGRILRNMFSNSASYLITAIIGFALAPFIVHSLGNTGYGLWTLVLALTGYFGLLDLGIRSSVGRFVARYVALGDEENVNRTVSTAFVMLSVASVIALVTTWVVVQFFFERFKVEPQYVESGKTALLLTGLNMACILPLGVFSAVLIAIERFDIVSGVTMSMELLRAALVVAVLKLGYGLVGLACIVLFVTIAQYSIAGIVAKWMHEPLRFGLRYVDRRTARELWNFGVFRFIWIVANQLIFYSASVVIGIFLNAAAITYFAIAASLINYGRNIVSVLTDTFAPSATRMDARNDLSGLRNLMIVATRTALLVSLPLCVGYVLLGTQFITLWMGPAYATSAAFLTILAIAQFASMPQYVPALILAGMARHRSLAYLALVEGVANITLSVILVQRYGLVGVAWATVIPNLVFSAVAIPWYTLRILDLSWREFIVRAWIRPVLCSGVAAAVGYFVFPLSGKLTWAAFIAEALIVCGVFGVLACFICFDAVERGMVVNKLNSMLNREAVHEA